MRVRLVWQHSECRDLTFDSAQSINIYWYLYLFQKPVAAETPEVPKEKGNTSAAVPPVQSTDASIVSTVSNLLKIRD